MLANYTSYVGKLNILLTVVPCNLQSYIQTNNLNTTLSQDIRKTYWCHIAHTVLFSSWSESVQSCSAEISPVFLYKHTDKETPSVLENYKIHSLHTDAIITVGSYCEGRVGLISCAIMWTTFNYQFYGLTRVVKRAASEMALELSTVYCIQFNIHWFLWKAGFIVNWKLHNTIISLASTRFASSTLTILQVNL